MRRALLVLLASCTAPSVGPAGAAPSASIAITSSPGVGDGALPTVGELAVTLPDAAPIDESTVFLALGDVAETNVDDLARGETPATILGKLVAVDVSIVDDTITMRPRAALTDGAAYTFIVASARVRIGLVAHAPPVPILHRVWPPAASTTSAAIVFCGDDALPEATASAGDVTVARGVGPLTTADHCVTAVGAPTSPILLAAGSIVGVLDPSDAAISPPNSAAIACSAPTVPFGPACANAIDDRAEVTPPNGAWLVAIQGPSGVVVAANPSLPIEVPALPPSTTVTLDGVFIDAEGMTTRASVDLATPPPTPRLVLTELMANPLGPEPLDEWLEITNAGGAAIDLGTVSLVDDGGPAALPSLIVEAGAVVVLAHPGSLIPGLDSRAFRLDLSTLGHAGFSNAGEAIELRDAAGVTLSRMPAVPTPKDGTSVARRTLSARDDDGASFVVGAPTPGLAPSP